MLYIQDFIYFLKQFYVVTNLLSQRREARAFSEAKKIVQIGTAREWSRWEPYPGEPGDWQPGHNVLEPEVPS